MPTSLNRSRRALGTALAAECSLDQRGDPVEEPSIGPGRAWKHTRRSRSALDGVMEALAGLNPGLPRIAATILAPGFAVDSTSFGTTSGGGLQ